MDSDWSDSGLVCSYFRSRVSLVKEERSEGGEILTLSLILLQESYFVCVCVVCMGGYACPHVYTEARGENQVSCSIISLK